MSTDRELLEAAARAAGVKYDPERSKPHPKSGAFWGLWLTYDREPTEHDRRYWNPLTDDGDALRLSVATGEPFVVRTGCVTTMGGLIELFDRHAGREAEMRAVRRLIVRAAASLTPPRTSDTGGASDVGSPG